MATVVKQKDDYWSNRGSFFFDFFDFLFVQICFPPSRSVSCTHMQGGWGEKSKCNSSYGIKNGTFLMTPLIRVYIFTPCRGKNLINAHHKANCDKSGGRAAGNLVGATASGMFLLQKHDAEKL